MTGFAKPTLAVFNGKPGGTGKKINTWENLEIWKWKLKNNNLIKFWNFFHIKIKLDKLCELWKYKNEITFKMLNSKTLLKASPAFWKVSIN